MHKSLTIFCFVFVLVCFLQATPQVTGTIVGGTVIDGYFNRSNSYVQIEIRLTGADASDDDMSGALVNLLYGSSTSASITIGTNANGNFPEAQDPKLQNNPEEFTDDGSDKLLVYKLYNSDLTLLDFSQFNNLSYINFNNCPL